MATPLTDSINALTAYANEVTGASDTNLSDAVYTLAQGYGSGGKSPVYTGTVTEDPATTSGAKAFVAGLPFDWEAEHTYIVNFPDNESTSDYAGVAIYVGVASNSNLFYSYGRRVNSTSTSNTTWLFEVTAGTTFNIYDMTE